jgi:hypothetical protein
MRVTKPGAAAVEVRQSVCSATDPTDSIGKLLKDYLDAAVSSRAAAAAYTAARAALLDYLDAAISSRAAAADYTAARAAKLDNLDATISSRASATDYTAARAALLDKLDALVSSRASAADYTTERAAKLDNLDAAISSRKLAGYAPSDDLLLSGDAIVSTQSATYVKVKENRVLSGAFRIKFDLRSSSTTYSVYGRIYRNDAALGTERSTNSTTYVTYSEDLSGWGDADLEQIYAHSNGTGYFAYVQNHRVYGTVATMVVVT